MRTLKQYRQHAGVSAKDAAEFLGVNFRTIYAWEDGSRPITAVNLFRLLKRYNADVKVSELPDLIPMVLTETFLVSTERGDVPK